MKTLTVLAVMLVMCIESPSAEVVNQAPRGFPPIHTNIEFFIINYAQSEHRGVRSCPDVNNLKLDGQPRSKFACSVKDEGDGTTYSATIEYKGTEGGKDYYLVTITAPLAAAGVPAPAEIAYEGREIELWKDAKWRIGIRPRGKGGEPDASLNGGPAKRHGSSGANGGPQPVS